MGLLSLILAIGAQFLVLSQRQTALVQHARAVGQPEKIRRVAASKAAAELYCGAVIYRCGLMLALAGVCYALLSSRRREVAPRWILIAVLCVYILSHLVLV
jgi:hypothetical protein